MLTAGTILHGHYVVESRVGQGGMGSVYAARDEQVPGRRVAVKEMAIAITEAAERERALAQFRREAQMLAGLEHPGLVPVLDFFEEPGGAYLVMELVDGQNLEALLQARPLEVGQAVSLLSELADVLSYLHRQQPPVLFRDLKPANVMLQEDGRVRLIDFGIARHFDPQVGTSTFIKGAGSPGYAPVEQYGGTTDVRSDVYALGATAYTLLTGLVPPVSVNMMSGEQLLAQPGQINASVPPAVEAVVLRAMALKREDRFASVAEFRAALHAAAGAFSPALALEYAERLIRAGQTLPPPSPPPPAFAAYCPSCGAGQQSVGERCLVCGEASTATRRMTAAPTTLASSAAPTVLGAGAPPTIRGSRAPQPASSSLPVLVSLTVLVMVLLGAFAYFMLGQGHDDAEARAADDKKRQATLAAAQEKLARVEAQSQREEAARKAAEAAAGTMEAKLAARYKFEALRTIILVEKVRAYMDNEQRDGSYGAYEAHQNMRASVASMKQTYEGQPQGRLASYRHTMLAAESCENAIKAGQVLRYSYGPEVNTARRSYLALCQQTDAEVQAARAALDAGT